MGKVVFALFNDRNPAIKDKMEIFFIYKSSSSAACGPRNQYHWFSINIIHPLLQHIIKPLRQLSNTLYHRLRIW